MSGSEIALLTLSKLEVRKFGKIGGSQRYNEKV